MADEEKITALTAEDLESTDFDFEAELEKQFEADAAALPEEEVSVTEDLAEYANGFPAWDLDPTKKCIETVKKNRK